MEGGQITNKIRVLRFKHGEMTQQELADKVGVTRQTINALEAAKYYPCLLYTSPSPRDGLLSRMPSSA